MKINKSDTALVVIDPQNDVLSEKGVSWGWSAIASRRTTPSRTSSDCSRPPLLGSRGLALVFEGERRKVAPQVASWLGLGNIRLCYPLTPPRFARRTEPPRGSRPKRPSPTTSYRRARPVTPNRIDIPWCPRTP
jgi:hypothetical protein